MKCYGLVCYFIHSRHFSHLRYRKKQKINEKLTNYNAFQWLCKQRMSEYICLAMGTVICSLHLRVWFSHRSFEWPRPQPWSRLLPRQKKDVRMLRFIQEVNTTTRSCALWDLEEETDYIVHVQSISMSGMSPVSEPLRFRTPKEAETQASKSKGNAERVERDPPPSWCPTYCHGAWGGLGSQWQLIFV